MHSAHRKEVREPAHPERSIVLRGDVGLAQHQRTRKRRHVFTVGAKQPGADLRARAINPRKGTARAARDLQPRGAA